MFQQVVDFLAESDSLCELISGLEDDDFRQITQFKGWAINDVISHLHFWNRAADLALASPQAFQQFMTKVMASVQQGQLREFEQEWLNGLQGCALRDRWQEFYREMCQRFGEADPKSRMKWAGPDMSVRSGITARLMETWAHGQAVYDVLGVERVDTDSIKNIVVLGINTFSWTFKNRELPVPEKSPELQLTAPSGDTWVFNESNSIDCIKGTATEFCQIVTQVRNVLDTNLIVLGDTAKQWMELAQCFAGPPENPPRPGSRFVLTKE